MKRLLTLTIALIMALAMTACGNIEPSDDGSDAKMINVSIEIDYPDAEGADADDADAEGADAEDDADGEDTAAELQDVEAAMIVEQGTTVIDMLYSYADMNDIEVVLDESSSTIYVTSINGVEQTADAGWVYEVNDEMVMEAADEIVLTEGMKISWEYTSWGDF